MARGSIKTRTLKTGEKRYTSIIRLNGKQKWLTFKRKKDAEEWLDRNSTDVRDGTYRELNIARFRDYAEHWRETHLIPANFKPSTLDSYSSIFDYHILPEFGPYMIAAISSAEINQFKAKLLGRGLSNTTVRNILNLLSRLFNDAIADSYLRHSPMQGVQKPAPPREKAGRALKLPEIRALLNVLEPDPQTHLMVLTALLTGTRRSELFAFFWEDFDWDHNMVKVRRELFWKFGKYQKREPGQPPYVFINPKSRYSVRDIDLSPTLRKTLRRLYLKGPKSGLVFRTKKGTPFVPASVYNKKFKPAIQAAGIEGRVRWHDLRHTFGALKLEQGENIYYLQRQMGHSSIQITCDIYGHLLEERKPAAASRTDELVFGDVMSTDQRASTVAAEGGGDS